MSRRLPDSLRCFFISFFISSFVCLCFAVPAGGQVSPGTPSFSVYDTDPSGYTIINLQNLNVVLNVPVMGKSGAFPFRFGLSGGDSYISGGPQLAPGITQFPLTALGNGVLGNYSTLGYPGTTTTGLTCPAGDGTGTAVKYSNWYVQLADGTQHYLPTTDVSWGGPSCSSSFTDQVTDNSGYTLSVTQNSVNSIYSKSGGQLDVICCGGSGIAIIDSNGNSISWSGSTGAYTDTLGLAVLTQSSSTNWAWTDVNGRSQPFSITNTSYTLRSAFGCTGKTDFDIASQSLPTTLTFPDSSTLGLAWELTPGFSADRTGRLATLTLRDGSSAVSFNYNPNSSANDGLSCTYLIPSALTRTTSDGTVKYTWTHNDLGNSTTRVDTGGNKTVYQFNHFSYPTPVLAYVQYFSNTGTVGSPTYSSTPNKYDVYCYNGVTTGCAVSTVTALPITERDIYTSFDGASSSREQEKYDAYGNLTYMARYDFGATTPTRATTITMAVNGSGNCSGIGAHVNNKPCSIVTADGSGNTISYSKFAYDAYGNLLTTYVSKDGGSTFLSNTTANVYNSNGTISKSYDLANHETDYTYASGSYSDGTCSNFAFPTQIKNVTTGLTTSATYDCTGGVKLTSTDANSNVTNYKYATSGGTADPWWRVMRVIDPLSNEVDNTYSATSFESSFEFNSSSSIQNLITTVDGYGRPVNRQKQQGVGASNYDTVNTTRNFSGVNPTVFTSNPCSVGLGSTCSVTYGPTVYYDLLGPSS